MDKSSYINSLLEANVLRQRILRTMIETLQLPSGSRGLDAGCGIGLQCLLLAEAIGVTGRVTGLDISEEMLDRGREIVNEAGLSARISFQEGDVANLPFDRDTFDWIWSADCVGYGPWEPFPLIKELVRAVKPGGLVILAAWSSETLLPGYPQLEARLRATSAGIAPFIQGKKPETHFLRALGWFHKLGLKECKAKVFADNFYAPLSDKIHIALEDLFDMRWPDVSEELSSEDLLEFQRLCLPDSPDFILNQPDYYALFTYTMFWGKK
jgi:demethylmenaquinone methyltransferase/2-methoxy-6-polyprenyl-1,4-benzoquinol methylase